jgi:hypothetical protein
MHIYPPLVKGFLCFDLRVYFDLSLKIFSVFLGKGVLIDKI